MNDRDLIGLISEASGDMIHVSDPQAYEKFRDGFLLFDVTPNASLLTKFREENRSEFGLAIETRADGSFRSIMYPPNQPVFFTYHKHASAERLTRILQEIEKGNLPEFQGLFEG